MQGTPKKSRPDSGAGLFSGICALCLMGYVAGSPEVAPMLPNTMQRAFVKLHEEMSGASHKAIDRAQQTLERIGVIGR
jgi:hypothetical protein